MLTQKKARNDKTYVLASLVILIGTLGSQAEEIQSPLSVFEQRIMPIFASPKPSSCVQCHLASVDLKDYIRSTSDATFQALRQNSLIDIEHPRNSKILQLISMGEKDADVGAQLIHAKTRQAEYEAFAAWIEACCADKKLIASTEKIAAAIGPEKPLEVVRHNRKDRLLDSFVRNVWSQRMRCFPCHTPGDIDANNPEHIKPAERHAEFVQQYGQKMNLFRETPEETLRIWLATAHKSGSNRLPLINLENPQQSLLLLKPTSKVPAKQDDGTLGKPSSVLPVSHMGGLKMHANDFSYKSFTNWILDYVNVNQDLYENAQQLPPDNWYPTDQVLRVKAVPGDWPNLATVQAFVFAWNDSAGAWNSQPSAFTQSLVAPNRIINGTLFLLANAEQKAAWQNPEGHTLPAGKYLLRFVVDRDEVLLKHPQLLLDCPPAAPQIAVNANWKTGFKDAEIIDGSNLE